MNFKGRLHFKQFIPSKRARCGIKFYKLCESTTGYTFGFLIYEGRDRLLNPQGCPDDLGVSGKLVWHLIQPLLHQGYHLYVDNYYSSVPLFRSLHAAGTGACGTIRKNRKDFPQQLVRQHLQRGTSLSYQQEEMMAVKFSDRKDVYMLTTIHPEGTVTVTERGSATQKEKPLCVIAYNKYMGGVDLSDQILQPYLVLRKSKTWYKKVAIYLIQVAIHNSFVLYKKSGGTDTFLQYQEKIIEHLMFQADPRQPAESEDVRRLTDTFCVLSQSQQATNSPGRSVACVAKRAKDAILVTTVPRALPIQACASTLVLKFTTPSHIIRNQKYREGGG